MLRVVADKETLRTRFKDLGGEWLAERLTPKLEKYAGLCLAPEGANLVVDTALIESCEGLPVPAATSVMLMKDVIVSMLWVPDEDDGTI